MQHPFLYIVALTLAALASSAFAAAVHRPTSGWRNGGDASNFLAGQRQASEQDDHQHKEAYNPLYFGLVVDAGSSGSRLRMFKWTLRNKVDLVEVMPFENEEDKFEVTPGLSAYADDPSAALPPLAGLLQAAQNYVPKAVWKESLLFVKATAGMRLLERRKAKRVMDTVRKFLSDEDNCPFKFQTAEIISGEQEAVFSFLTSNYYLGTLGSPSKTAGALEMGGASMQVIFRPPGDIQDNEFQFYLSGERQSVYAKSYIKFGVNDAMVRAMRILVRQNPDKATVESPCHNRGFEEEIEVNPGLRHKFIGTGNATGCAEVVRKMMGLDIECLLPPCAIFGNYMAPPEGRFYAIAAFFYAVNGLGLVGWKDAKALKADEIADATELYCEKDLKQAQQDSGQPMQFAKNYCFMGNYVHQSLLALGFNNKPSVPEGLESEEDDEEGTSVIFSRKLNGFNLGWAAGAMLYETQLMPVTLEPTESVRGLCNSPVRFSDPRELKAGAQRSRLATMAGVIWLAFLSRL